MARLLLIVAVIGAAIALSTPAQASSGLPGPVPHGCYGHVLTVHSPGKCVNWVRQMLDFMNPENHWYGRIPLKGKPDGQMKSAVSGFQRGCDATLSLRPGEPGYMSGGVTGPSTWQGLETYCWTI